MTQNEALNILKTGQSVFLTGEPGSGKTFTVNEYVSWLKRHGIQPAITASTGIAATHIGGMTIHSFAGIGIADYLSRYDIDRISSNEKIAKRILGTSVLIIDEISMLDATRLAMVDAIFRTVRTSEMPFGGIQVVLVGDFFQLPPVNREQNEAAFAFLSPSWTALSPTVCYLTEQHRQEDGVFLNLLSAIRRNEINDDHMEVITTRQGNLTEVHADVPRLFSHNADVDRINAAQLAKLPGNPTVFTMTAGGSKTVIEQLKRGCLSPEQLELKKDAVVMFTKNSNTGRFVNGTLGIVAGFDNVSGLPIVKLKNGYSVEVAPVKWAMEERGKIKAAIEQIPLRLAWAMTVHKSQGMSMDAAVMDLSQAFEYGQGYVALSRVRTLDGLHLRGINARALAVHPLILEKDAGFRGASDEAIDNLAKISDELNKLQEQFIRACGGEIEEKEIADEPVTFKAAGPVRDFRRTGELVKLGHSMDEIAEEQKYTKETIVRHLERLLADGKILIDELSHFSESSDASILEIQTELRSIGSDKLKPVYEHFDGRFSYDEIRLARLLNK